VRRERGEKRRRQERETEREKQGERKNGYSYTGRYYWSFSSSSSFFLVHTSMIGLVQLQR
jgi:hypothetical protein